MRKLAYSLLASATVMISCNSSNISSTDTKPDMAALAKQMAQVECKAMELREQRFALADEIRFTEEAIMQSKRQADTIQLAAKLQLLNDRKELLFHASMQMAEQIKHRLDSLMENELTTAEAKASFNKELNTALERDCACEDQPQRTAGIKKAGAGG